MILVAQFCKHQETEVARRLEEQRPDAFIRLLDLTSGIYTHHGFKNLSSPISAFNIRARIIIWLNPMLMLWAKRNPSRL